MQTNPKSIDMLDEMLRLAILEQSTAVAADAKWIEQMAEFVFSAPPEVSPADEKSQALLLRLREELKKSETFGDLLSSKLQQQNNDPSTLVAATKLSRETLEQLSRDSLFPNRVPVLLMKNLIEVLSLSFDKAKTALQRTATLITELQDGSGSSALTPIFARRRAIDKTGKARTIADGTDDFLDSYITQTSLDIYLQRLKSLFSTMEENHE
jgi:hypothetical protein